MSQAANFIKRSVFVVLIPFLLSLSAQAQVWNDVNTWSPEWETQFATWVQQNWQADFFSRKNLPNGQSNPYYGLHMDCADTVYSMRMIFSFEHQLPFVVKDPTTEGKTISNRMTRWNGESREIQRMRNFMMYMYDMLSTHSLPDDTFPVPVSREWIHSGSLMKTVAKNHHSWSVKEILPIGVPHLIFNSTVGAHSGYGLQERISWPNPEWVFESDFTAAGTAGFRYWRPASALNLPVWEVPNYSEEQYHIPLGKWNEVVQAKLATNSETDDQTIHRLFQTACDGMRTRVSSINDGLAFLREMNPDQCMDYDTYDTYSTPNRDHRLFDDLAALRRTYKSLLQSNGASGVSSLIKPELEKIFPYLEMSTADETARMTESSIDQRSTCLIEYSPGKKIDLAEAKRRLFANLMSNNPLDEVEYRWGERQGPSAHAKACPSWDAWAPDLTQGN